ncbi:MULTISPECIES: 6,7-dimethyl-8-ribityllumazine synthase [unclassified Agrococcus]|uniref:6,7-dimethyl-8-ribityllumazine synthase n=1 Tax=unclassified Agrococcus TaxID=2615065 RepID=UPI00361AAD7C
MAGSGAPHLDLDATGVQVAIVYGQWHDVIAGGLLDGARRSLASMGATVREVPVAGAFELAVVSQAVLERGADAVVALGVILRGGTPHFDFIAHAATDGLTQVALRTGKPVGFGVLTIDDEQQGIDRAGLPGSKEDTGAKAAEAAVGAVLALRSL